MRTSRMQEGMDLSWHFSIEFTGLVRYFGDPCIVGTNQTTIIQRKSEPSGSFMAIVTNKPRRNLGTFMDNSFNRTCHPYLFPQPLFWSGKKNKKTEWTFYACYSHWTPVPHSITSFPSLHTLLVPPIGFPIFTRVSYLHSLYGRFYDFSCFIFALD